MKHNDIATLQHVTPCSCGHTRPIPCMVILPAVVSYMAAGLATQDQHNPYTLERIVAT